MCRGGTALPCMFVSTLNIINSYLLFLVASRVAHNRPARGMHPLKYNLSTRTGMKALTRAASHQSTTEVSVDGVGTAFLAVLPRRPSPAAMTSRSVRAGAVGQRLDVICWEGRASAATMPWTLISRWRIPAASECLPTACRCGRVPRLRSMREPASPVADRFARCCWRPKQSRGSAEPHARPMAARRFRLAVLAFEVGGRFGAELSTVWHPHASSKARAASRQATDHRWAGTWRCLRRILGIKQPNSEVLRRARSSTAIHCAHILSRGHWLVGVEFGYIASLPD